MTNNITHLRPASPAKIVFAIVLFFLSLYLFLTGAMYGIILLAAAIRLALREGIEIDLDDKKYRNVWSVFGIHMGAWKSLPAIEYVSVFKTTKKSRARVISAEANLGFQVYKLNLFHNRNRHIEAYVTEDREDAFKVANHFALALDTEVYDATKE